MYFLDLEMNSDTGILLVRQAVAQVEHLRSVLIKEALFLLAVFCQRGYGSAGRIKAYS